MRVDLLMAVNTDLRCAYCGLDHKVQVRITEVDGKIVAAVVAMTEGIDVMDYRTSSIIEADDADISS